MKVSGAIEIFASRGVEVARFFYQQQELGHKRSDIAAATGLTESWVGSVLALGKVLFGFSESPMLRERAIAVAERNLLGIEVLKAINASVRSLTPASSLGREELRLELYQWAEGRSVAEVKAHATARVRELNGEEHTPWRRSLRISATADAGGQRHLHLSLADATMAQVESDLHRQARGLRKRDPSLSHSQAMADAATSLLTSGGNQEEQQRLPMVIIPITGARHAEHGLLSTTDGAQIHFSELADAILHDHGLALFYGENATTGVPEPVGIVPFEPIHDNPGRYANNTQRLVAQADQVLCADPDCHRRAVNCQLHHVQAASKGGVTSQENLVAVCATHHGGNDDDPEKPKNGRYERCPSSGRAGHRAPGAKEVRQNLRPAAANSARAIAHRMFEEYRNDPAWQELATNKMRALIQRLE
ncbi:HNH endonuclease signature motif containing protein [Corynebacterium pelargi]|uniref:Uncharacterized protein n=1 Tax=Corynebacterium pelargi TaxID=1471400 RepID=A0A410W712_9CORY|nr:HNH endonuclease signature motif containing protein [Corynebacterium pelargi]QAU51829.1 hypothetical protein CPELA_02730 [Corynebacterium pelargi]GGG72177.1 hypothetical protein GCM10007338_06540 [Corynebacterium pelargi]